MFKNIYIPVDNSDYSNACVELALEFAKGSEDTTISASHVYAAKMHDVRFRQMESGLPEEYQDEQELEKQRAIHDQLITIIKIIENIFKLFVFKFSGFPVNNH